MSPLNKEKRLGYIFLNKIKIISFMLSLAFVYLLFVNLYPTYVNISSLTKKDHRKLIKVRCIIKNAKWAGKQINYLCCDQNNTIDSINIKLKQTSISKPIINTDIVVAEGILFFNDTKAILQVEKFENIQVVGSTEKSFSDNHYKLVTINKLKQTPKKFLERKIKILKVKVSDVKNYWSFKVFDETNPKHKIVVYGGKEKIIKEGDTVNIFGSNVFFIKEQSYEIKIHSNGSDRIEIVN